MGVIAVGVVENAALAQNAIYLVDLVAAMERVDIGLRGEKQLQRSIGVLPQNGLAADDDDLLITGDISRRADYVLKVLTAHVNELLRRSFVARLP